MFSQSLADEPEAWDARVAEIQKLFRNADRGLGKAQERYVQFIHDAWHAGSALLHTKSQLLRHGQYKVFLQDAKLSSSGVDRYTHLATLFGTIEALQARIDKILESGEMPSLTKMLGGSQSRRQLPSGQDDQGADGESDESDTEAERVQSSHAREQTLPSADQQAEIQRLVAGATERERHAEELRQELAARDREMEAPTATQPIDLVAEDLAPAPQPIYQQPVVDDGTDALADAVTALLRYPASDWFKLVLPAIAREVDARQWLSLGFYQTPFAGRVPAVATALIAISGSHGWQTEMLRQIGEGLGWEWTADEVIRMADQAAGQPEPSNGSKRDSGAVDDALSQTLVKAGADFQDKRGKQGGTLRIHGDEDDADLKVLLAKLEARGFGAFAYARKGKRPGYVTNWLESDPESNNPSRIEMNC
jgi:hypothetical protein